MCVGMSAPKAPPPLPERQSVQQPRTDARQQSRDLERRRAGMLSTILTSARGDPGALLTTNQGKERLG